MSSKFWPFYLGLNLPWPSYDATVMDLSVCSETTWAVGIAQLTHHEVQGGGNNPETEGRGIFAPTADRVVS